MNLYAILFTYPFRFSFGYILSVALEIITNNTHTLALTLFFFDSFDRCFRARHTLRMSNAKRPFRNPLYGFSGHDLYMSTSLGFS